MPNDHAAELLDRLYALTDQNDQWPVLVERLLEVLNQADPAGGEGEALAALGSEGAMPLAILNEQRLLGWLTQHVQRVLEWQQREQGHQLLHDFFDSVLGRQPVAMALCDNLGQVRWKSQGMREALAGVSPARIEEMVRAATPRPSVHHLATPDGPRRLVLVDVPQLGPHHCALLLPSDSPAQLDPVLLDRLHGLTRAEAGIANLLAQGLAPEDIAHTNGTSLATVRGQIKKILAKLGVSRQAEAVAVLLAGAAQATWGPASPSTAAGQLGQVHAVLAHRELRLAHVVLGPADGHPVIFMHSWVGSRKQVPADTAPLFEHGIKLVAIDRPGMGASTGPADLTPQALADGVQALAQHLGHEQVGLLGYSLGCHYAMACAQALPGVVNRLFLVSPVAPMRGLRDLRGTLPSGQLLMGLAMKAPVLAETLVKLWMSHMRRRPALYLDSVLPHLAEDDLAIMASEAMRQHYVASFLEAIRQGDAGLMRELRDMASPFTVHRGLSMPVTLWHGTHDTHVPLAQVERMAGEMAGAQLHTVPKAGHFLIYHQWAHLLAQMAAAFDGHVPVPS